MIYDQTKNLSAYKGISKNLDAAIDYVLKTDIMSIPDGKHPIDGTDAFFVQVSHNETKNIADGKYEAHKKYIDIQMVVGGREGCYYLPLEGLAEDGPFNSEKDIGFYKGENKICFPLEPGMFAIFFPQDAHKPSCDFEGKKTKNHKVLMKILV